jgi:hypothetical protein
LLRLLTAARGTEETCLPHRSMSAVGVQRSFLLERGVAVRKGLRFLRAELPTILANIKIPLRALIVAEPKCRPGGFAGPDKGRSRYQKPTRLRADSAYLCRHVVASAFPVAPKVSRQAGAALAHHPHQEVAGRSARHRHLAGRESGNRESRDRIPGSACVARSAGRVPGEVTDLILKRAPLSRSSGTWGDDDYDVLHGGEVVGRNFKDDGQRGRPWFWGLAYGHHRDRSPMHGHEPTREAAMAAFAKSWRRE